MTNYWVTATALANDSCHFVLVNEKDEVIWDVKFADLGQTMENFEYPEDAIDHAKQIDAYPHEGKENILLVYETVKGTMFNLEMEAE